LDTGDVRDVTKAVFHEIVSVSGRQMGFPSPFTGRRKTYLGKPMPRLRSTSITTEVQVEREAESATKMG